MIFEKKKNRSRVVKLGKNDWYETFSGAKFPIKQKPMAFADLQIEFNEDLAKVQEYETKRIEALKNDEDFDLEEYAKIVNDYLEDFYNTVKLVTEFNGYSVDKEYIKANLGYEDPYWYVQSVSMGKPIYSIDEYDLKKKK
jgi:hypothetical protein